MYKITVPVKNENFERAGREEIVKKLKSIDAQRVFLAFGKYETDKAKREKAFKSLKENTEFLKGHGFEVGAWLWTYLFNGDNDYPLMKFASNTSSPFQFVCPSDEKFRSFAGEYIKDIAKCGVDMILYDDDYSYGFFDSGMGCVCENHLEYMENLLGEKLPENVIDEYLISGSENKYRSAWLEANKYFMLKFAEDMRKSLDEINPEIRLGACSCMSAWDFDGADSIEISKKLAGKTKPFMRLIGAPYWAVNKVWGRLQDIIETERMESAWCANEDIEILSEGDVYPRPRFNCPASYLEGFDMALRADGGLDGIVKYVLDYTSNANYENGYVKRHIENKEIYKEIENVFGNKKAVGVRVYESMKKFEHMDVPKVAKSKNLKEMFFSPAARMLASSSIPTVYEGIGQCGIVFGENAKYIPDEALKNGLIIDARAAEILCERGIDVGFESKTGLPLLGTSVEYFVDGDEYVQVCLESTYDMKLKSDAKVQSYFIDNEEKYPASYIYENADGQRFFVFAFDGYFMHKFLYRQYTRSKQLAQNIKWLSGKKLSAYISGNPDLYVMSKSDGKALAVGLWNFFEDYISEPVIKLDKEYSKIKFINCTGRLEEDTVYLSKIQPYEFAGFEVE